MSETIPNPEQSMCSVYAEIYYHSLFLYRHPGEEKGIVARWWGVSVERVGDLPEWNDNRLKGELNSAVRNVCQIALEAQGVQQRNETPTDEQMHNAHIYVSEQWEIGKSTAQELIDKEPALNEYPNPMQDYKSFIKVWRSTQKGRRDLSLDFFGINTEAKGSD